jgi:hypothetical protein
LVKSGPKMVEYWSKVVKSGKLLVKMWSKAVKWRQGDALVYSITVRGLCVHEMVLQGESMWQVR